MYDPWGRRIWKQWAGFNGVNECEAYFYGAAGQKLESYSCEYQPNTTLNSTTLQGINTYFGGKMLSEKGVFVATDRLGSVRCEFKRREFGLPVGRGARDGDGGWADEVRGILPGSAGAGLCDGSVLLGDDGHVLEPAGPVAFTPPIRVLRTAGTATHMPEGGFG